MSVFVCGPAEILVDECPVCGGWLHVVQQGGVQNPSGGRCCSQDCIDDAYEETFRVDVDRHLSLRDLLCNCTAICAPRGLPSAAQLAEYREWCAGG